MCIAICLAWLTYESEARVDEGITALYLPQLDVAADVNINNRKSVTRLVRL